jgi:hypothetical protein
MPAAIVHYLHADRVLKNIKVDVKNKNAYYLGAQGPDFFFCHRYLPWMKGESFEHLGNAVHEADPNEVLISMYNYCVANSSEAVISYFYGFLCHYSIDSVAHPYINAKSEILLETYPNENLNTLHNEIESALDTIMLRSETGELPGKKNLKSYVLCDEYSLKEIGSLWVQVISEVLGVKITQEKIVEAFVDTKKVFGLLNDRTGFKKQLTSKLEAGKAHTISCHIRPLLEDMDPDFANTEKAQWGKDKETYDFFELYEMATKVASEIINAFVDKKIEADNIGFYTKNKPFG